MSDYTDEANVVKTALDAAYAKKNHTHSYVPTSAIKNDLTTGGTSNVLSAEQGKTLQTNKLNKNADDTSTGYITAKGFKVSGKSNFLKADGTTADANNYSHPTYTSKTNGLYKITVDGTGHVSGTASVGSGDLPSHTHPSGDITGFAASKNVCTNANGVLTVENKNNHTHTDGQITYTATTNNSVTPIDLAAYEEFNANRLAYLKANNIICEYTTNANATTPTWTSYGTDANKIKLVTTSASFVAGNNATASANNQVRVTLDAGGTYNATNANGVTSDIYMTTRKILVFFNSAGGTNCKCKVETSTYGTPTTWTTTGTYTVNGQSGWNSIPLNVTWGGYPSQLTDNRIKNIRLTFSTESAKNVSVSKIRMIGETAWVTPSTLAQNGHIYTYDENQNTTFPGKIIKSGGTTSQFLKANGDIDSNVYIHTAGTNLSKSNNTLNHATSGVGAKSSGLYKTTIDAQGHITAATAVAKEDITGLGIPAQDTTYTAATVEPKTDYYANGVVGTSAKYAREDHRHSKLFNWSTGGVTTATYVNILEIKATTSWNDRVITFTLQRRAKYTPTYVAIKLTNTDITSSNYTIDTFYAWGDNTSDIYLRQTANNTWNLIAYKAANDSYHVTDVYSGMSGVTITGLNTNFGTTAPTHSSSNPLYKPTYLIGGSDVRVSGTNLLDGTQAFSSPAPTGSSIDSTSYQGCSVRYLKNTGSSNLDFGWTIPQEKLEPTAYYTLSFWAKTTTEHSNIITYLYNSSNNTTQRMRSNSTYTSNMNMGAVGDGATQFTITPTWKRYHVIYKLTSTAITGNKSLLIRVTSNTSVQPDIYLAGVKFEKGSIPTEWCPSPNDKANASHGHGKLSSGGVINYDTTTAINKVVVTDTSNNLRTSSTIPTTSMSNNQTYSNLGSNLTTQKLINDAVNTKIGTIPSAGPNVPPADSANGSAGGTTTTTYSKSDHSHPKSSLYAPASHNQATSTITSSNISFGKFNTGNGSTNFIINGTQHNLNTTFAAFLSQYYDPTFTFASTSGITWHSNAYVVFYRVGYICFCEYWIRTTNSVSTGEKTIGTIPADFVPYDTKYQDTQNWSGTHIRLIWSGDGNLIMNNQAAGTVNVIGTMVYLTNVGAYSNYNNGGS